MDVEYVMIAFKPQTNKYYTQEVIYLPDIPVYELADKIRSGDVSTPYKDMIRVFVPGRDNHSLYCHPFMVCPSDTN